MITTKNTYDSLGRITSINYSHNDKTLADYHYKWDAANRITEINDDKYGYDKTNQLLSAVYAKKPKEQYAYDLNGNRLTALLQGQEKKYETGKFNRLLSENGEKLEYDAEGNRIAKGDVKYFWDHRNRLIKVVSPSETIEYTYDYQNRLVSRKTEKGKEYFVHDGWQIVLMLNGNGSVKERLLWGTHQDELLAQGEKFMLNDHLNTVRDVISADGKIIAHYDYNAFGKCLSPLKDVSFAYTGKMTDSATGLQWNINRWYDANVGRWISEDPIGFEGVDENLYRYADNCTLNNSDFLGNFSITPFTFPGNFEASFSFLWGTRLVVTLDIESTDGDCCLSYQLKGGVTFSIRDRILGVIGLVIPKRIHSFLTKRLPDVSANVMIFGDLGKLDNPYTNRARCRCVKCKRNCALGLTGGAGLGNTNRGGGESGRVFSIGGSVAVQGSYDFCSGSIQAKFDMYFSIAINFGYFAYNRNLTQTILEYP